MHLKEVCLHPGDCNHIIQQAGSGQILRVYKGDRQVGYGVFSEFFKRYGLPLLKSIGAPLLNKIKKEGLEFGKEVGQNIFINKESPKEAIKKGLKRTVKRTGLDLLEVAHKKLNQFGSGRRRSRRRKGKAGKAKRKRKARKSPKTAPAKRGRRRRKRRSGGPRKTKSTITRRRKGRTSRKRKNTGNRRRRTYKSKQSSLIPNVFGY